MVDPRRIDPSIEHPEAHGRDPEKSWEEQLSEGAWEFGRPPVTEPYRPGEDPTVLPPLPEEIFTPPSDVGTSTPAPDKKVEFTKLAIAMQKVFNDQDKSLRPDDVSELKARNQVQDRAFDFRPCLSDLWADGSDVLRNPLEKEDRAAFDTFLKELGDLPSMLDEWDRRRRKYPYDWDGLNELGTQLNDKLREYLDKAKQLETGELASTLGPAALASDLILRAVAFELGRQGMELGGSTPVDYGSAPEAVAGSFVALTQQNDAANLFRNADVKKVPNALAKSWTTTCGKPTNVNQASIEAWNMAIKPMETLLSRWATAARTLDPKSSASFEKFNKATTNLRNGIPAQRSLLLDANPTTQKVPDILKNNARDGLEVLNDEIVKRLQDMINSGALDLEATRTLEVQVNSWKKLRQLTTTEKDAQSARDRGLSDFWSDSKAQILTDIAAEANVGKALSDQLNTAFNENLGNLLDNWTTESKKIPKHDPVALHDAAWKLRFTIRRYRQSVNEILKVQAKFRQRLLTALDGLQFALAGQIRDYRQQGYRLF